MKTPRFYRTSAGDEEKLARAREGRDRAVRELTRQAARLELFHGLVRKYERSLGLALGGEVEKPVPKPRKGWLEDALDQKKSERGGES